MTAFYFGSVPATETVEELRRNLVEEAEFNAKFPIINEPDMNDSDELICISSDLLRVQL